ncbi:MAG: hypothetical protein ACRDY3_11200 [Acidimicrobiales bacterium]
MPRSSGSSGSDRTTGTDRSGDRGSNGAGRTGTSPGWTTGWQRLSETFLRPPTKEARAALAAEPDDYSRLNDDEKRARITAVDPIERKIGMAAAALAAVLAIIANVPYMVTKTVVATTTKPVGHHCPGGLTFTKHGTAAATCNGIYPINHYVLPLIISLVLAGAIYVAARMGRRAPLAFAAAITGVSFGTILVVVPFIAFAGWILLRGWRTQKYGASTAKSVRPGYTPPAARGSTRRTRSGGPTGGGRPRGGSRSGSADRKGPEANKRYTPKAPPKKKVPPRR